MNGLGGCQLSSARLRSRQKKAQAWPDQIGATSLVSLPNLSLWLLPNSSRRLRAEAGCSRSVDVLYRRVCPP